MTGGAGSGAASSATAAVTRREAWWCGRCQADAMSTGSLRMPTTPGVQSGTRNGFLRDQRLPDPAPPREVVPAPSTVVPTRSGALAPGVTARRPVG